MVRIARLQRFRFAVSHLTFISCPLTIARHIHRNNRNYPPRQQERLNKTHYAGAKYRGAVACPCFKDGIKHDLHHLMIYVIKAQRGGLKKEIALKHQVVYNETGGEDGCYLFFLILIIFLGKACVYIKVTGLSLPHELHKTAKHHILGSDLYRLCSGYAECVFFYQGKPFFSRPVRAYAGIYCYLCNDAGHCNPWHAFFHFQVLSLLQPPSCQQ